MTTKIGFGIYVSGIFASSVIGVYEQNTKLIKELKTYTHYREPATSDYAMASFGGLMLGGFMGLWWPVTLIGVGSSLIYKYNNKIDSTNNNDKK